MEVIPVYNGRNQQVGYINEEKDYRTDRDFNKGQIFFHPKYKNQIGIDRFIIKDIIMKGCNQETNKIIIKIINVEKNPYYVESIIKDFLKRAILINHEKKCKHLKFNTKYRTQYALPLSEWNRVDNPFGKQLKLTKIE